MTPLLFATALTLMAPTQQAPEGSRFSPVLKDLPAAPLASRFSLSQAKDCSQFGLQAVDPGGSGLKKLGDLPPGLLEHAVLRIVQGCPVREIVFAGQTYYLGVSGGQLEPIDPVARRPAQH